MPGCGTDSVGRRANGNGDGVADSSVIGQVGEVVVRVRGGDLPGEIVASVHGIRETFLAYADKPLERGASVLVVAVRGPRQVDVIEFPA